MSEPSSLIAILDASVLYPAPLRHLFVALAITGAYRARWTSTIQDEWTRSLLRDRPDLDAQRIARTRYLMDSHIADAIVDGYEHLIGKLTLPDPGDRHVLAAAIRGGANVIVTANLRHFPAGSLAPHGLIALHPDTFLLELIEKDPELVFAAVREHRLSLLNPPKTPEDYLAALERHHMTATAAALRAMIDRL
jgi:hypothetical protein